MIDLKMVSAAITLAFHPVIAPLPDHPKPDIVVLKDLPTDCDGAEACADIAAQFGCVLVRGEESADDEYLCDGPSFRDAADRAGIVWDEP